MTNTESHAKIESINPVLAVAPIKEETEMSEATNKITALYCRLSQEDREPGSPCPLRTKRASCSATARITISAIRSFSLMIVI